MTEPAPVTAAKQSAPGVVTVAMLLLYALFLFQAVALPIIAIIDLVAEASTETAIPMVYGLVLAVALTVCFRGLFARRRWSLPATITAMILFGLSGVYRTIVDASLGSVFTAVTCAAVAGLLLTPAARAWFSSSTAAAQR